MSDFQKLIDWRKKTGKKPSSVWVWYGYEAKHKGAFDLEARKPSRTDDYRALIGLDVTVCAKSYSPILLDEFERMKGYASSLILWVESWQDDPDSIITWTKRNENENKL